MRKTSKMVSVLICIAILFSFPVCAKASTKTGSIFTSSTYTHQDQFDKCKIIQGVDLSKHNGTVNFAKMKKAGVKYVILRAGYRGYATEGSLNKDIKFEEYIKAAAKQGLEIGIYFYSQAITTAEAQEEAKYTVNVIKDYKKNITLPVAFDYEFAEVSSGRFDSAWKNGTLNKTKCTKIAKAFCNKIKSLGYQPLIYANKSFLSDVLDGKSLSQSYPIWLANYTTKTTYDGKFYIWQFSSTGTIDGVSGYVDSNFLYSGQDFVTKKFTCDVIPNQGFTGQAVKPSINVKCNGASLVKGEDYYVSFSNNVNIGKATVKVTGCNDFENVPAASFSFNIVPAKAATPVLTKRKATSLTVKWDEYRDADETHRADGYRVSYLENGKWINLVTTSATSATLSNLSPAKDYPLIVQAYMTVNGVNLFGVISDINNTCTKPGKVKCVATAKRSDTYIKLSWNMQANADGYTVYKYNDGTQKYEEYKKTTGGKNCVVVKDLKANTRYKFRVSAYKVNEKGVTMTGSMSDTFADYTSPKAPVLKSAVSNSVKKITVKHSRIASSGYQVKWSTTSSFKKNTKTMKFSGEKSTKNTVTTYRSGGSYYVKVRAYKVRNGKYYYSPWSDYQHVYTK